MGIQTRSGEVVFAGRVAAAASVYRYTGDGDYTYSYHVEAIEDDGKLVELGPTHLEALGAVWFDDHEHLDSYNHPTRAYRVTVDATNELRALAAQYAERARRNAEEATLAESRKDVAMLLSAKFHPAVRVVSTRASVAANTLALAFYRSERSFQGHPSVSYGLALSTRKESTAKGARYADVQWAGSRTFEVVGAESETHLCLARAAFEAGYDAEDVLALFDTGALHIAVAALPAPCFVVHRGLGMHTSNAGFSLAPWVEAVKAALGDAHRLDNAARHAEFVAAVAADKAREKAQARAAKAAERAAARKSKVVAA